MSPQLDQSAFKDAYTGQPIVNGGQPTPKPAPVATQPTQSMPTIDDITKQINDAYNGTFNYLNQAEQTLRNQLPGVLQEAQTNYDTNANLAGNQFNQANTQLNQNTTTIQQQYESALAAARRLYNQLQTGYQQRFGGSSSAGGAASEIASEEQQRQQGQLMQNRINSLSQIDTQRQTVQQNYNQTLMQLNQQKQAAINQANRDFQNQLLQINQARGQAEDAKANARLQALQQLRDQVFSINQQNSQAQQALTYQAQQAQAQLDQYKAILAASQNAASGAVSGQASANAATNPGDLTVQGGQQGNSADLTGMISNLPASKIDYNGPLMGPINTNNQYSLYNG